MDIVTHIAYWYNMYIYITHTGVVHSRTWVLTIRCLNTHRVKLVCCLRCQATLIFATTTSILFHVRLIGDIAAFIDGWKLLVSFALCFCACCCNVVLIVCTAFLKIEFSFYSVLHNFLWFPGLIRNLPADKNCKKIVFNEVTLFRLFSLNCIVLTTRTVEVEWRTIWSEHYIFRDLTLEIGLPCGSLVLDKLQLLLQLSVAELKSKLLMNLKQCFLV